MASKLGVISSLANATLATVKRSIWTPRDNSKDFDSERVSLLSMDLLGHVTSLLSTRDAHDICVSNDKNAMIDYEKFCDLFMNKFFDEDGNDEGVFVAEQLLYLAGGGASSPSAFLETKKMNEETGKEETVAITLDESKVTTVPLNILVAAVQGAYFVGTKMESTLEKQSEALREEAEKRRDALQRAGDFHKKTLDSTKSDLEKSFVQKKTQFNELAEKAHREHEAAYEERQEIHMQKVASATEEHESVMQVVLAEHRTELDELNSRLEEEQRKAKTQLAESQKAALQRQQEWLVKQDREKLEIITEHHKSQLEETRAELTKDLEDAIAAVQEEHERHLQNLRQDVANEYIKRAHGDAVAMRLRKTRESQRKAAQHQAALERGKNAIYCSQCQRMFTFFSLWKKQCMRCGLAVCEKCSPNTARVAGFAEPQRVCTKCWKAERGLLSIEHEISILGSPVYRSKSYNKGKFR
eukprot:g3031.t1